MKRLFFCIALIVVLLSLSTSVRMAKNLPVEQGSLSATQWIAVTGYANSLYLIHPDSSGRMDIAWTASDETSFSNLKWSPDGQYLAFIERTRRLSMAKIWVYSLADGSLRELVADSFGGFDWYPDGSAILFDKYAERATRPSHAADCPSEYLTSGLYPLDGLYRYDLDTGEESLIIAPTDNYPLLDPEISPDGRYVIFSQHEWDNEDSYYNAYNLYVVSLDSPEQMNRLNGMGGNCSWSRDSQMIACGEWDSVCVEAGSCPIVIFSTTGGEIERLPALSEHFDLDPLWSPVRAELAFSTTEYRRFADGPCGGETNADPSSEFPVELYSYTDRERQSLANGIFIDWSPDGQYLLTSSGSFYQVGSFPDISIIDRLGNEPVFLAHGTIAAWQPGNVQPEAITDLGVELLSDPAGSHPLKLSWTAIEAGSEGIDYQVRYARNPLTDESWAEATVISASWTAEGGTISLISENLPRYEQLYLGVKASAGEENWSELSNTVHLIDSGFRVNPDAYQFPNYFDDSEDVTVDVVRDIFGDLACMPWTLLPGQECEVWLWYEEWRNAVNSRFPNGRCVGMAANSLYYYGHPQELGDEFGNTDLYSLELEEALRQDIARTHVRQWTQPYMSNFEQEYSATSTPAIVLDTLLRMMQDGTRDQGIILLQIGEEQHAITPVALQEEEDGWWKVWVYDSNSNEDHPEEYKELRLYPDADAGRWVYYRHAGENSPSTIWVVPLPVLFDPPPLELFSFDEDVLDQLWVDGNASILIANEDGERIGFIDGEFINEIADAFTMPLDWGSKDASMPVFYLPADEVYTVTLEQLPGSTAGEAVLSYFTRNSVLTIEGIQLVEAVQEELVFDTQNTRISYSNEEEQVVNIRLVVDEEAQSTRIDLSDIRMPAGEQLELARDAATQQVTYSQSSDGTYQLDVIVSSEQGTSTFRQTLVEIVRRNQHAFNLAEWVQGEAFKLLIDEDGDGEPDRTRRLANEAAEVENSVLTTNVVIGIILLVAGFLLSVAGIGGLVVNHRSMRKYRQ